jgi:hypothetical protein
MQTETQIEKIIVQLDRQNQTGDSLEPGCNPLIASKAHSELLSARIKNYNVLVEIMESMFGGKKYAS